VERALLNEQEGDTQPRAELLAATMGLDFNYYVGNSLALSSRRELYDAGILDRRLSGSAYAGIFLRGERFHVERENIGSYRYAVGYKPLIAADGGIEGIIAVPALYRQEEIDEEVARTNALLFGMYAIIVLVVTVIATTLAHRIAAPIHSLTEATKHVSYGDLDIKVRANADGEIGELIRSFEAMTRDLKRNRENLVQYERELAWKEMAKQVAHEIKNPLTPMKLALQHLQQTYRDKVENFSEVFEEVSQMIIRQVDALSRIASEFSHFARMPMAHLERCDVNEVLLEAARLFDQDEHVKLEHQLDRSLPPVVADREELRRAFINIIRNGIQATVGKGRILLSTALKGAAVEIRIQDFGTGIPEEIKHKLFQPNFSTKTDGMGLGLAIVKKTIDDLNGTIEIESEINKGTTVIIRIPTAETLPHEFPSDPAS
jgi:nitrogen fixation/metabolism regulation signal transduction histidine kinase